MAINVMIVDDDQIILNSLQIILNLDAEIQVVEVGSNGDEAFKQVLKNPDIDIILMDIQMPVSDGILATKNILSVYGNMKIIMLTTFDDDEYIYEALKFGAKGYMLKNASPDEIIEAVKIVHSGKLLVHPGVASKLPRVLSKEKKAGLKNHNLSPIELSIMKLIAKGRSNKEISEVLFLAEGTVKNKITDILNRLGLRDRTQIAVYYLNNGKIDE